MSLDDRVGGIVMPAQGEMISCETNLNQEPCEGMVFESEEAARAFYDAYATQIGFFTRVLSSRKSERDGSTISRGLGCRGAPDNPNTRNTGTQKKDSRRQGCTSMIVVKREKPGRWVVRKFVRDHNHSLLVSLPKGRPSFDEKDKRIQELTAELRVKKRLSTAYREQLLSLMKDVEGHNEHLSMKVQVVSNRLKTLEAKEGAIRDLA